MHIHRYTLCILNVLIFLQADLLFKKEEKEKSEATAKTLELGTCVLSVHLLRLLCNQVHV